MNKMSSTELTCAGCRCVISNREYLRCSLCQEVYERKCTTVSEQRFYNTMTKEHKLSWKCDQCRSKQPKTGNSNTPVRGADENVTHRRGTARTASSSNEEGTDSLLVLEMRSVGEQLRAVRRQMEELTATVSGAMLKIEACNERIDGLSARMDGMERRMNEISGSQRDGGSLLRSIAQLKSELNERDQELLLNDVELSCVPEQQGEAVGHVILTLATKLGVPLTERDVVSATRMGRVPEPREGTAPRPRVIAVRLARRALRDQLIQAARVRRGATTEGAGLPGTPRRFYVNERLTRANRQLFQKAREAARQHGWRFCWTRNGKVYVRKHPGGDAVKYRVHSEDDLEGVFGLPSVCSSVEKQ